MSSRGGRSDDTKSLEKGNSDTSNVAFGAITDTQKLDAEKKKYNAVVTENAGLRKRLDEAVKSITKASATAASSAESCPDVS